VSTARRCPECGARVSAFAAGCASCGADLEAYARRERLAAEAAATAPRRGPRLPRPSLPRPSVSVAEGAWLAATVFCVAFVSALGILLAVLGGMHGVYEGRRGLVAAYVVLGVIAAARELSRL
jgi:hypothetical protein